MDPHFGEYPAVIMSEDESDSSSDSSVVEVPMSPPWILDEPQDLRSARPTEEDQQVGSPHGHPVSLHSQTGALQSDRCVNMPMESSNSITPFSVCIGTQLGTTSLTPVTSAPAPQSSTRQNSVPASVSRDSRSMQEEPHFGRRSSLRDTPLSSMSNIEITPDNIRGQASAAAANAVTGQQACVYAPNNLELAFSTSNNPVSNTTYHNWTDLPSSAVWWFPVRPEYSTSQNEGTALLVNDNWNVGNVSSYANLVSLEGSLYTAVTYMPVVSNWYSPPESSQSSSEPNARDPSVLDLSNTARRLQNPNNQSQPRNITPARPIPRSAVGGHRCGMHRAFSATGQTQPLPDTSFRDQPSPTAAPPSRPSFTLERFHPGNTLNLEAVQASDVLSYTSASVTANIPSRPSGSRLSRDVHMNPERTGSEICRRRYRSVHPWMAPSPGPDRSPTSPPPSRMSCVQQTSSSSNSYTTAAETASTTNEQNATEAFPLGSFQTGSVRTDIPPSPSGSRLSRDVHMNPERTGRREIFRRRYRSVHPWLSQSPGPDRSPTSPPPSRMSCVQQTSSSSNNYTTAAETASTNNERNATEAFPPGSFQASSVRTDIPPSPSGSRLSRDVHMNPEISGRSEICERRDRSVHPCLAPILGPDRSPTSPPPSRMSCVQHTSSSSNSYTTAAETATTSNEQNATTASVRTDIPPSPSGSRLSRDVHMNPEISGRSEICERRDRSVHPCLAPILGPDRSPTSPPPSRMSCVQQTSSSSNNYTTAAETASTSNEQNATEAFSLGSFQIASVRRDIPPSPQGSGLSRDADMNPEITERSEIYGRSDRSVHPWRVPNLDPDRSPTSPPPSRMACVQQTSSSSNSCTTADGTASTSNEQNATAASPLGSDQSDPEAAPRQSDSQDRRSQDEIPDVSHYWFRGELYRSRSLRDLRRILHRRQQRSPLRQQTPQQSTQVHEEGNSAQERRNPSLEPAVLTGGPQCTRPVHQQSQQRLHDVQQGRQLQTEGVEQAERRQESPRRNQATQQTPSQERHRSLMARGRPVGLLPSRRRIRQQAEELWSRIVEGRGNQQGVQQQEAEHPQQQPPRLMSQILEILHERGFPIQHRSERGFDVFMFSHNRQQHSSNVSSPSRQIQTGLFRGYHQELEQHHPPRDDTNQTRQHNQSTPRPRQAADHTSFVQHLAYEEVNQIITQNTVLYRYQHHSRSGPDGNDLPELCIICMWELVPSQRVRRLPCFHVFHMLCIDRWLRNRLACPICRNDILDHSTTRLGIPVTDEDLFTVENEERTSDEHSDSESDEAITNEEPMHEVIEISTAPEDPMHGTREIIYAPEEPMDGASEIIYAPDDPMHGARVITSAPEEPVPISHEEATIEVEPVPESNEAHQRNETGQNGLQLQIYASNVTIRFTEEQ